MMHWFGYNGVGMGFGGGLFMILFWGIIIYIIISLVRKPSGEQKESPEEILKNRYARGEITKEEFEAMKRHLKK